MMSGDPKTPDTAPEPPTQSDLDEQAMIDEAWIAKNGDTFASLWAGSWQGASFGSQSEADLTLCAHYGNRCLACGRDDVKLTADHIVPLARGGSDDISNIQPLCARCNSKKGTKTMDHRPDRGMDFFIFLVAKGKNDQPESVSG
jgi:5-methylcytosine-specific restriction endonuclease McrA